jgi:hypothetical protein
VAVTKEMMSEFIRDILDECMPAHFRLHDDRLCRLTYLKDNVIRVEPSAEREFPRSFVFDVIVREL